MYDFDGPDGKPRLLLVRETKKRAWNFPAGAAVLQRHPLTSQVLGTVDTPSRRWVSRLGSATFSTKNNTAKVHHLNCPAPCLMCSASSTKLAAFR
jgi:hypothetical protein